jgi:transposase InsO family protein
MGAPGHARQPAVVEAQPDRFSSNDPALGDKAPAGPLEALGAQDATRAAKDALWTLDFFVVRTLHGRLLQVMVILDVYTRELLGFRAYDGWDVDSAWTMRTLSAALSESQRKPTAVMHDRAPQFAGQVERQLRVLEVDHCRLPPRLPALNGVLERAVKSLRFELLDQIRVAGVEQLQQAGPPFLRARAAERLHAQPGWRSGVAHRAENVITGGW